jgi:hypothetical protein
MSNLMETLVKLVNQPDWNIYRFEERDGQVRPEPWYPVTGAIAHVVAIRDADLETQVQEVASQVQFWGRMEALAERALQWEERQVRVWEAQRYMEAREPKGGDWKKPTEAEIQASYRLHPDYDRMYTRVERAREALTSTRWVREAWVVKAQLMRLAVRRSADDSMSIRA